MEIEFYQPQTQETYNQSIFTKENICSTEEGCVIWGHGPGAETTESCLWIKLVGDGIYYSYIVRSPIRNGYDLQELKEASRQILFDYINSPTRPPY